MFLLYRHSRMCLPCAKMHVFSIIDRMNLSAARHRAIAESLKRCDIFPFSAKS